MTWENYVANYRADVQREVLKRFQRQYGTVAGWVVHQACVIGFIPWQGRLLGLTDYAAIKTLTKLNF